MIINDYQRQWLDDLRSGEFPQGQAKMKRNGKYCCMGVAAERHGALSADYVTGADAYGCMVDGDMTHMRLPDEVNAKLHMTEQDNSVLATLNDDDEFSFVQIANFAQKCWLTDTSFYDMQKFLQDLQYKTADLRFMEDSDV